MKLKFLLSLCCTFLFSISAFSQSTIAPPYIKDIDLTWAKSIGFYVPNPPSFAYSYQLKITSGSNLIFDRPIHVTVPEQRAFYVDIPTVFLNSPIEIQLSHGFTGKKIIVENVNYTLHTISGNGTETVNISLFGPRKYGSPTVWINFEQ